MKVSFIVNLKMVNTEDSHFSIKRGWISKNDFMQIIPKMINAMQIIIGYMNFSSLLNVTL